MEIPFELIKQVQISLRRQANLPSYDPHDTSFADLDSAEEAAAELDPSPAYLRCRHCKGRLLRGLQSFICVFCGRDAFNDIVPEPINFKNTLGCRWLLDSLTLDGSEIVQASVEANNKGRGRTATNDEFPLSDLLELEIKWQSGLDEFGSCLSNEKLVQSKASVNLSGVNIENFFSNEDKGPASKPSIEPSVPVNQIYTKESIGGHDNLNLFESAQTNEIENTKEVNLFDSAQSSKSVALSTEYESNFADSGWGADFQSAPSIKTNAESTSFDPFVGSADLSVHMDEVFGPAKDSFGDRKESVPVTSDWFSENSLDNSNSGLGGPPLDSKIDANLNNGRVVANVKYSSSTDVELTQHNIWQKESTKEHDNNADDGADSGDDWNDFASSTTTQDPFDSWKQTPIPADDKTSEMNLFAQANQQQDTKSVDSFLQRDLLARDVSTEASVLDRASDANTKARGSSDDVEKGRDVSTKTEAVEAILSRMPDLSFMLDSNLSIPPTKEGFNSSS